MQNAILSDALLKQQIESLHGQSVKNGFYDDYPTQESRRSEEFICSRAMLISGELAEAYEAYRSGKIDASVEIIGDIGDQFNKENMHFFVSIYRARVKGTVAEELADVYIRICCVAGSVGIYQVGDISEWLSAIKENCKNKDINSCFFRVLYSVLFTNCSTIHTSDISQGLAAVYFLADKLNIDLHKHVKLKAFYNTTREYKHGRNF